MIAATAIVAVAAALTSLVRTPVYASTAQVLVDIPQQGSVDIQPNMDNEKRVAGSLAVAEEVARHYEFGVPTDVMLRALSVDVPVNTDILSITYVATEPKVAQMRAQAFAETYLRFRTASSAEHLAAGRQQAAAEIAALGGELDKVERRASSGDASTQLQAVLTAEAASYVAQIADRRQELQALQSSPGSFEGAVIASAQPSTKPAQPNHLIDVFIGVFAGLILGIGLSFAQDRLDGRPRSSDEIEQVLAVPVLSTLPVSPGSEVEGPSVLAPYRLLAARIVLAAGTEPQRIGIARCTAQRGADLPALELAEAWASRRGRREGEPVVLVRADRSTSPPDGGSRGWGLTDALLSHVGRLDVTSDAGVAVVPFGTAALRPEDLVPTTRLIAVMDRLADLGSPVIVEAPPVLSGLAGETLASVVDALILVVDRSVTRNELLRVRSVLSNAGAPLLGVVISDARRSRRASGRGEVGDDPQDHRASEHPVSAVST